MEWKNAYILVRPEADGTVKIVHTAEKLKDARYWLQYIALAGDAVFVTPANPQYKGKSGEPTYMSHLIARGKIDHTESKWKNQVFDAKEGVRLNFVVAEPEKTTAAAKEEPVAIPETQILQLANGKPHPLSLELLSAILQQFPRKFQIVLADASKWIEWESALTLMTQDMYVVGVDKQSKWPLTVTLKPDTGKGETMNYESAMKFVVRQRNV